MAGLLSALFVGQIYTVQFKELMPSKLRMQVTAIFSIVQIILGVLYSFIFFSEDLFLFIGFFVGLTLFYAVFIYLMLGFGGTSYLRAREKAERKGQQPKMKKR